jgi:hypothetical protein
MLLATTTLAAVVLPTSALAAPVGGFVTPGAVPTHGAALQVAALLDGERAYGQSVLLLDTHWRNLGFDGELTGLAGTGVTRWEDAAFGTVRLGVRAFFDGKRARHAIGVGFRTHVGEDRVGFWVTHYSSALAASTTRLTWDVTLGPPSAPFSLRASVCTGYGVVGESTPTLVLGPGTGVTAAARFGWVVTVGSGLEVVPGIGLDVLVRDAAPAWVPSGGVSFVVPVR